LPFFSLDFQGANYGDQTFTIILKTVDVAGPTPTVYGDFGGSPLKCTLFDQIIHCIRIQLPQHSSVWLSSSISDFEIGGGKKRKKLSKLLGNVTKVSQAFHSIFPE
jgi:hypothetical protein